MKFVAQNRLGASPSKASGQVVERAFDNALVQGNCFSCFACMERVPARTVTFDGAIKVAPDAHLCIVELVMPVRCFTGVN